jgi:tellurite resistance-related uncharacterized protein
MAEIPADARAYRRTPEFTEAAVPHGLQHQHSTKAGVWGRIVVVEGSLIYRELSSGTISTLDKAHPGVVEPEVLHEVEVQGPVRFYVEFLRRSVP